MIDNLKIRLNSQKKAEEYIKSTGNYTQSFWIGRNDTENKYPLKKKVDNLELRVTKQNSVLSNSLHKYYNINKYGQEQGNHNYNNFPYKSMIESLDKMEEGFKGLNLNDGYLQSLEFGFNLLVQNPPRYYLENNFLLFEHKAPVINKGTNAMIYKKFEHGNLAWKVYDKGTQYGLKNNVLRIEIVLGSIELRKLGINTLKDLRSHDNLSLLYSRFMESFKGFTIVDSRFQRDDLPEVFVCDLGNRLEPSYWSQKRGKNNLFRDKKELIDMIEKNNLNTTELYFKGLIENNFVKLLFDCLLLSEIA